MRPLHYLTIATLIGFQPLPAETQKPLPKDAEALRLAYLRARTQALEPIDRKYADALEKLLASHTRAGKLDDALAIKTELETLKKDGKIAADGTDQQAEERIRILLTSNIWVHLGRHHYKFTNDGRFEYVEGREKGRYKIDPKTSSVSFKWDTRVGDDNCGIRIDEEKKTYTHFHGQPFQIVPNK